jgi:hypothetical protein
MELFKNLLSVVLTLLALTATLILAARQLGVSQIFISIVSTFISAAAVGVVVYLRIQERNKHDSRDHHGSLDDPSAGAGPSAGGQGDPPQARRARSRRTGRGLAARDRTPPRRRR